MKKEIPSRYIMLVASALMNNGAAKSAVKFIDEKTMVRATWRHRPRSNNRSEEMVITIGGPNYRERDFVKAAKKASEPFPIKKIQFRAYPAPKRK